MRSHLALMLVFCACVSIVFAALMRDHAKDQLIIAARMFGGLMAAAFVLGWLMLPFPV
jgi:hypothetical protein